ncbi:phosphotransferase family protein [Sulfitobacter sp. M57]|uniref:choline/ethanolamine kinase family protein n=1 Tax=unclassified Sulfitobacter TaxID=196795 RepID=UPI0023E25688|nr:MULTISPECIES: choline/ethanolamine kinase family protein [unclassified Sulfitobacter]MDF3415480.1 phosphotransferase family protein [Sulfitobacter sp. KE5]MDF3422961.1 phosphotransferase family protein [Sulfitobacter sp. KE43]MDF3434026.1 phosphotransferase family protein [Sulfitobacter sp. KE42]MDF3459941.1 phosphotransferase family protein [Sulfitobacter sp. S74]MDF3463565.1 phosphotransferase family protein [Sulfitobacter sp. Ks18]
MTREIINKIANLSCFQDPQDITALGGGLTNVNLRVRDGTQQFVVRLGEDIAEHGVMRWNELALSQAASAAGFSPKVIHHEPGVLVLEFLNAQTFSEADVRNPDNLQRIISMITHVHRDLAGHLSQPVLTFWPFQVNRSYAARLHTDGSHHAKALPAMLAQLNELEAAVGQIDMVIGHNDLLAANILDDGDKLWLIDWEYGGYNSPLFDLAGLASNNALSEDQERAMLAQYFETSPEKHWRAYSAMKCTSLMRETLWSMTSEIHSELDVDYGAYTSENMERLTSALADFAQT